MSAGFEQSVKTNRLFESPPGVFDEVYGIDAQLRPGWQRLIQACSQTPSAMRRTSAGANLYMSGQLARKTRISCGPLAS